MALRVSPERVRDVRFAEQWRGYRTDEVDEFVEQVAEAFDQLERRLGEAAQRTALAERRLEERGPDEDLRRTLVLAQRTADAALEEARTEAARVVADAEERARSILDHLEERKARVEGEIDARVAMELAQVSDRRAALEADVELLSSYVGNHRARLVEELRAHLAWLEGTGPLGAMPASRSSAPAPAAAAEATPDEGGVEVESPRDQGHSGDDHHADDLPADGLRADDLAAEDPAPDDAPDAARQDDTVLDDLDIPWADTSVDEAAHDGAAHDEAAHDEAAHEEAADGGLPHGGSSGGDGRDARGADDSGAVGIDDDPFIAELRRAVDDPEPLGPRDESAEWSDDVDLYDRHKSGLMRSRRRRRP